MGAGIYYESIERLRQLDAFFLRNDTCENVAAADSFLLYEGGANPDTCRGSKQGQYFSMNT